MGLMASNDVSKQTLALLRYPTIALDSNIFIYVLGGNKQFPVAIELLRLLPKATTRAFTSVISLLEATIPSYRTRDQRRVIEAVEVVYGNGQITVVDIDRTVALRAAQLRAQFPKLKAPDAIQLATALVSDAAAFITADRDFEPKKIGSRYVENVRIEVI